MLGPSVYAQCIRGLLEEERRRVAFAMRNIPRRRDEKIQSLNTALECLDELEKLANPNPKEHAHEQSHSLSDAR